MELLKQLLIEIAPFLILAATAIYLFHEYMRERQNEKLTPVSSVQQNAPAEEKDVKESTALIQIKLQAAERFVLYLERIEPGRLVMRLHKTGMTSKMLQAEMVRVVREELDHNLSQQIYLSDTSWELVKNAKEEMIKIINIAADSLGNNSSGIDLGKKIFEVVSKMKKLPHELALGYLRQEVHKLIG